MDSLTFLGLDAINSSPFLLFLHLLQVAVLVALIRHLDVYEREPFPVVLAMFVWGGLFATLLSLFGNDIVANLLPVETDLVLGPAIEAPLVEETAKGVALVAVFAVAYWWSRRRRSTSEFGGVTDGIVYGATVGFGFAFVENIFYFVQNSTDTVAAGTQVLLDRVDFTGLQVFGHGLYTACLGAGLGYAMWTRSRTRQVLAVLGGLSAGMLLHALWNGTAQLLLVRRFGWDTVLFVQSEGQLGSVAPGVTAPEYAAASDRYWAVASLIFYTALLAMAVVFVLWLRYERKIISYELAEEANHGLITAEEYRLLPSVRARYRDYLARAQRGETLAGLRLLHDRLTDLAIMKWRLRLFGGDQARVDRAREQIALLRTYQREVDRVEASAAPEATSASQPVAPAPSSAPPPAPPPAPA